MPVFGPKPNNYFAPGSNYAGKFFQYGSQGGSMQRPLGDMLPTLAPRAGNMFPANQVKPSLAMPEGFMNRINAGVSRSLGDADANGNIPLHGLPENPPPPQHPLNWSAPLAGQLGNIPTVPVSAGRPSIFQMGMRQPTTAQAMQPSAQMSPAPPGMAPRPPQVYGPGSIFNRSPLGQSAGNLEDAPPPPVTQGPLPATPQQAAGSFPAYRAQQTVNNMQRVEDQHKQAIEGNRRFSGIDSSQGVQGLNPTAPLYPQHPYAGKFPLGPVPAKPQVEDNIKPGTRAAEQAVLEHEQGAANQRRGIFDPVYHQQQISLRDSQAANATRDFEAQKLALQRRKELDALKPYRPSQAEIWAQSQYKLDNPGLFVRGANPEMTNFYGNLATAGALARSGGNNFFGNPLQMAQAQNQQYATYIGAIQARQQAAAESGQPMTWDEARDQVHQDMPGIIPQQRGSSIFGQKQGQPDIRKATDAANRFSTLKPEQQMAAIESIANSGSPITKEILSSQGITPEFLRELHHQNTDGIWNNIFGDRSDVRRRRRAMAAKLLKDGYGIDLGSEAPQQSPGLSGETLTPSI